MIRHKTGDTAEPAGVEHYFGPLAFGWVAAGDVESVGRLRGQHEHSNGYRKKAMSVTDNIVINVLSNFIFVGLVALVVGCLYLLSKYGRLGKAREFFGVFQERRIKIYVSGFEHPGMRTKKVANALEYEAAVEVQRGLEKLGGYGLINRMIVFLAGLIGLEMRFPPPNIEVSPLDEVKEMPSRDSAILIGGPVTNQLSRLCLSNNPRFRFNQEKGLYQERINDEYTDIAPSGNTAIIEKRIIDDQVIFVAHGYGEEQTKRAAQYLINHWKTLYQAYKQNEFAICV